MKKKIISLFLLFFIFLSSYVLAANTYSAPLSCSTSSLYYAYSWGNRHCIAGDSTIFENLNGKNTALADIPKIVLQSTDELDTQWVYVEKRGNSYYFDIDITRLDTTKQYVFKAKSNNASNTYGYQDLKVNDTFFAVSTLNKYVTVKDNIITVSKTYSAPLSCSTSSLYYAYSWGNRHCIAGDSTIFENLNGKNTALTDIPKIVLQSTDGLDTQWVYVEKRDDNYYFDIDITRLDTTKQYVFKAKSNNASNTYGYQNLKVNNTFFAVSTLNKYITVKDNIITVSNTYSAPLSCSTSSLYYAYSWGNRHCIAGNSTIFENLNGKNTALTDIPKIVLQSTDGLDTQWVYVEKRGDNYYFDIDITRLDTTKQYVFKAKSNNASNTYGYQNLKVNDTFFAVSTLNKYITVKDNIITVSNTYSAPLSCSTSSLYYAYSWGDRHCIAGDSTIFENLNGTKTALTDIPKIVLQSTDGLDTQWVYVQKNGNSYYFDVDITRLDLTKQYSFKVKSNNSSNTYGYQTLKVANGFIAFPKYNIYATIKNNIITLSDEYSASIKFEPAKLYFMEGSNGSIYLAGTAVFYELFADGTKYLPTSNLKLELRSTDETVTKSCYVEKVGDEYFFSVKLDDLDFSLKYYLQIIDTNPNNLVEDNKEHVWIHSSNNNSYKISLSSYSSYLTFTQKVEEGIYGQSGLKVIGDSRGTDLKYYKMGNGENVFFATFAIHGYEDLWAADGKELTLIAEDFVQKMALSNDEYIGTNWTIYVFPQCNPDGVNYGYTNNGPGRCTLTGVNGKGVDMNRCWSTSFVANYSNRNYTGSSSFGAYEARYLRDFMLEHKSKTGQTIVIDLHGWTTQLIGDRGICLNYFGPQFYGSYNNSLSKYTSSYGSGYMINWARYNLSNSNGVAARSALIELPSAGINGHTSVVNAGYAQKYYNAVVNMLKGIL